ncbi:hypothetical protein [Mesorhizobium argentiipisi]|uniref:Uncharacterized protein n=1 Tax=Mesorhizobium argentiipisi TaxID=3015175 RepID=A0ABU8KGQ8_9HYPH
MRNISQFVEALDTIVEFDAEFDPEALCSLFTPSMMVDDPDQLDLIEEDLKQAATYLREVQRRYSAQRIIRQLRGE